MGHVNRLNVHLKLIIFKVVFQTHTVVWKVRWQNSSDRRGKNFSIKVSLNTLMKQYVTGFTKKKNTHTQQSFRNKSSYTRVCQNYTLHIKLSIQRAIKLLKIEMLYLTSLVYNLNEIMVFKIFCKLVRVGLIYMDTCFSDASIDIGIDLASL